MVKAIHKKPHLKRWGFLMRQAQWKKRFVIYPLVLLHFVTYNEIVKVYPRAFRPKLGRALPKRKRGDIVMYAIIASTVSIVINIVIAIYIRKVDKNRKASERRLDAKAERNAYNVAELQKYGFTDIRDLQDLIKKVEKRYDIQD